MLALLTTTALGVLVATALAGDPEADPTVAGVLFGEEFTAVAAYGGPSLARDRDRRLIAIADRRGGCDGKKLPKRVRVILATVELGQDAVTTVVEPGTDPATAPFFAIQDLTDVRYLVGTATITVMPTALTPGRLQVDLVGVDPAADHVVGEIRFEMCDLAP